MAEPTTPTAAAMWYSSPALSLWLFGAAPDALVIGLVLAGLTAAFMDRLNTKSKSVAAILIATLAAGFLASPVAAELHSRYPAMSIDSLRPALALIVSIVTPTCIQLGFVYLEYRARGGSQ